MNRKTVYLVTYFIIGMTMIAGAQTSGDYRSKQTGAWNIAASWEMYNGSGWVNAGAPPTVSNGIITVLSGHVITAGSSISADQLVINSGGVLAINGGTFTVNDGPAIDLDCNGTVNLSGGTLDGAGFINCRTGSIFNWGGGVNGGSGTMDINAGAVVNMNDGDVILAGTKTINNHGTWVWTSGVLNYDNVLPVINNYSVFNIYTDADCVSAGTGSFNNKPGGIINKIGSPDDETSFSGTISFDNEGTVNVNSSKINWGIDWLNTATINIAFGAAMKFSAGTSTFDAGTAVTGAGYLQFAGSTVAINAATISSNIAIAGGTVTVVPDLVIDAGLELGISSGVLTGPGNISFHSGSSFTWSGGLMDDAGIITIDAGAIFTMDGVDHYLSGTRTINNYGEWTWTSGLFYYKDGAPVINNYGVFNINTDDNIDQVSSNAGSFNNMATGIINKRGAPTDETFINNIGAFTNAGIINVISGKLRMDMGSLNSGTVDIFFGANMNYAAGTTDFNTGTILTGAGTLNFEGSNAMINDGSVTPATINISAATVNSTANLVLNSGQRLNLSNGELTGLGSVTFNSGSIFYWSGGVHSGSSPTDINSGASFTMDGGLHSIAGDKTINNHSTWTWNGGAMYFTNGSPVINNYSVLNINTDDDILQGNTTGDAFNNTSTGIINKEGSATDATAISDISSFNNAGIIHILSGNLELNTDGVHNGNYEIDFGGGLKGVIAMSFTGTSFINNGIVYLGNLDFNGVALQDLQGEGIINMMSVDNAIGVNLDGTQTINPAGFTIFPASKFKVYGHLILL